MEYGVGARVGEELCVGREGLIHVLRSGSMLEDDCQPEEGILHLWRDVSLATAAAWLPAATPGVLLT